MVFTYGERAVDVFYVKDVFGFQVNHDGKIESIRTALLDVLGGEAPRGARARAR